MALRKLTNYTVLLLLATVISTYGVTSGSTATVIGAMLVAPLMTPIMGTTFALVLGQERRALRSLLLTAVSVAAVILLALLLAVPTPFIDFADNAEITSRVRPGLPALIVALAAGAAGAFATSRKEIGDSLPGVAIAISLVPPLSVVGIALGHGEWDDAFGAFVLFITNFLAIILAGSGVLWLSGANVINLSPERAAARKRAYVVTGVSTLLVVILLGVTSYNAYLANRRTYVTQAAVQEWIGTSDYETVSVDVRYPNIAVTIAGQGDLEPVESLASALDEQLRGEPTVVLRRILRETQHHPDRP
jgi:uncharacterized hydrophobic protein (TIGR00271 family)